VTTTSEPEPKGSESSLSDKCVCGHPRSEHVSRVGACITLHCPCDEFELSEPAMVGGPHNVMDVVCIGSGTYLKQPYAHSPTLRSSDGRCFQCEPLSGQDQLEPLEKLTENAVHIARLAAKDAAEKAARYAQGLRLGLVCRCNHVRSGHERLNESIPCEECDCQDFDNRPIPWIPAAKAVQVDDMCGDCGHLDTQHDHESRRCSQEGCNCGWLPEAEEAIGERDSRERESVRTYCDGCGCWDGYHNPLAGCEECECRIGEAVLPPLLPLHSEVPLPAYAVVYAVTGGQQYEIVVPGDASVVVEDGMLMVIHPQRPALGIASIRTQPTLTRGEEQHDAEAEGHGR